MKNWSWDLPATTAVWSNNQIGKYIDRKWATILKDVFSATANWFWKVFFQPNEFTVLQDSYAFSFKQPVKNIKRLQMYFVSVLNKIYSKYSWENKSWWNKIKEEIITLPTYANWELAYDYMEDYVKEIEAYLKSTGLSNYNLTKDEELALKNILSSPSKKFTLDELFDVSYWNADIQKTDIWNQWDIVVSAWENNYWIIGRTTKQANLFDEKTITIDMFWYAFLRTFQYKMVTHGRVLSLKPKNKLSNDSLLYMLWLLKKTIHWYWFDNMLTWKKIKENVISLPISEIWEIDFNCINSFVKATQKLVVKDLVDNINKKLSTYKDII